MSQLEKFLLKTHSLKRMSQTYIEELLRASSQPSHLLQALLLTINLSHLTRTVLALLKDLHSTSILRIEGLHLLRRPKLPSKAPTAGIRWTARVPSPPTPTTIGESFTSPQEELSESFGSVEAIVNTLLQTTPVLPALPPSYPPRATPPTTRSAPQLRLKVRQSLFPADEAERRTTLHQNIVENWYQNQREQGIQPRMSLEEAKQLYQVFHDEYVATSLVSPEFLSQTFMKIPGTLQFEEAKANLHTELVTEPALLLPRAEPTQESIEEPSLAHPFFLPTYAAFLLTTHTYSRLRNLLSTPLFAPSYLMTGGPTLGGPISAPALELSEQRPPVSGVEQEESTEEDGAEAWYRRQEALGIRPLMSFEEARQLYHALSTEYVASGEVSSESLFRLFMGLPSTHTPQEARAELRSQIATGRPPVSLEGEQHRNEVDWRLPISPLVIPSYAAARSWSSSLPTLAALSRAMAYSQFRLPPRDTTGTARERVATLTATSSVQSTQQAASSLYPSIPSPPSTPSTLVTETARVGALTPSANPPTLSLAQTVVQASLPPSLPAPLISPTAPTLNVPMNLAGEKPIDWVSKEEAAQLLGIQSPAIQRQIDEGRIRTRRVGATERVLLQDLRNTIREQPAAFERAGLGVSEHNIDAAIFTPHSTLRGKIPQTLGGTPARQSGSVLKAPQLEDSQSLTAQNPYTPNVIGRRQLPVHPALGLQSSSRASGIRRFSSPSSSVISSPLPELDTIKRLPEVAKEQEIFRPTPLYLAPPSRFALLPAVSLQQGMPRLNLPSGSQPSRGMTDTLPGTLEPKEPEVTAFPATSEVETPFRPSEAERREELRRLGRRVAEEARRYLGSG